jgi:hypothetical protein
MFPALVEYLGLPSNATKVPFNIVNATVAYAVEDIVLGDLLYNKSVDFWWIGGCQLSSKTRVCFTSLCLRFLPYLPRLATRRLCRWYDGLQAEPHHLAEPPSVHGPPP